MKQAPTRTFYQQRLKAVLRQLKEIFGTLSSAELETLQAIQMQMDSAKGDMNKSSQTLQKQVKQWRKASEQKLEKVIQLRDLYRKTILFVMYLEKNVKDLVNEQFSYEFLPGLDSYLVNLELYLLRRNLQDSQDDLVLLKELTERKNIFTKSYLKLAHELKQKLVHDAAGLTKAVTSSTFHMGKKMAVETGKHVKKHAGALAAKAYAGAAQTGKRVKRAAEDALVEAILGPAAKKPHLLFQ